MDFIDGTGLWDHAAGGGGPGPGAESSYIPIFRPRRHWGWVWWLLMSFPWLRG